MQLILRKEFTKNVKDKEDDVENNLSNHDGGIKLTDRKKKRKRSRTKYVTTIIKICVTIN